MKLPSREGYPQNVDLARETWALLQSGNWPTITQVRCGARDGDKVCGKTVDMKVVAATRQGLVLAGWESVADEANRGMVKTAKLQRSASGAPKTRHVVQSRQLGIALDRDENPCPWHWANCTRHDTIAITADVHSAAKAGRKTYLTAEVVDPNEYPPTIT